MDYPPRGFTGGHRPVVTGMDVLWLTAGLGCDGETISITAATQPALEELMSGALPWVAKIKLHNPLPGEQSYIYEMGIPIVELGDDCWHVDVQQKVPLSRDRDNVNPAYLRKVRAAVLNAMVDKLTPEETELGWVEAAAGAPEAKEDTIKTMLGTRFGNREMVLPVTSDPGATREAQSQGAVVLDRALTGDLRKRVKDLKNADGTSFIAPATDKYKTLNKHDVSDEVPEEQWSQSTRDYVAFIERVSPELIDQRVEVRVIDKDDSNMMGCLKWQSGIMFINLALIDTEDWVENYDLFIHEMAHASVHNNDHLSHKFYNTVSELGAKLVQLAIERPDLFKEQKGAAVGK